VATKGSQTMFIITPEFKFLDVMNYLGPGTSYDKWIKAYGQSHGFHMSGLTALTS